MDLELLIPEVKFRTSRSSGAGGQHVNKVETKVELLFDVQQSAILTDEQKQLATERLENRINKNGILIVSSQKTRSQLANKEDAIANFLFLIEEAIRPVKKRKKRRRSKADKEKRLKEKKMQSEKKALRKKVTGE
ncbi:MAG TPA: aminoacyl-tRNA hydrolase [Bacteroidetes bacterium]|nr:aminoacyl-tRNA hydrolase [Bacteroidota bacterium]